MMRNKLTITYIILALLLAGCGFTRGKEAAEIAVSHFHEAFNRGDLEAIREEAHQQFRSAASLEEYMDFMNAVKTKLGKVQSTSNQTWQANSHNLITRVVMVQRTVFEHGEGTETFTFQISGEEALLLGYHVESMALITR